MIFNQHLFRRDMERITQLCGENLFSLAYLGDVYFWHFLMYVFLFHPYLCFIIHLNSKYFDKRVGTPTPQRKTLIVDTGSHHTAWPCKGCQDCGEDHHTDAYFDPDMSETFHVLQCRECRYESRCESFKSSELEGINADEMTTTLPENVCMVRQSYTEGSSWTAYQARDMVFCGGKDVFSAADPVDARYAVHFMFGCQMSSSGLFHSQLADGIMGLRSVFCSVVLFEWMHNN